ncbi:Concanavalin A-like lectin/glucanases superfamily protein [compost metagenome]|uniref:3',5'-cyclic adenosine monophosphate phosphodiesterase CpdA n=1 Tax=Achromobacter agilis TaxID=1353888 RepID=A0A446CKR3_9BURK|nr:LamG-like jellyroll fold domain-containing protein [Achromobacter agilis]SSW68353.1 3',5'-cyclic adenosine monophosphate phosphodiesterase CpdA [Achromobacter agilis]
MSKFDEAKGQQAVTPSVPTRRTFLRGGLAAALIPGAGLLTACGGGDDDDDGDDAPVTGETPQPGPIEDSSKGSRFALAVLPDTQFYARYATVAENSQYSRKFGSEPFMAQTYWIAANAAALNIPFVTHLGDVVDQASKPDQWKVADQAMRVLETAKVPYSVLAGNHDVLQSLEYVDASSQSSGTDAQRNLGNEPYLQWFNTARAKRMSTFGGRDTTGFHEYHVFEAEGQKFMVLSLSWRISDDGIAWARRIIGENPGLPVILVNHQLLNIDRDGVSPLDTEYGNMLWERLIRDNDQIFMTLNGHHHGAAHRTRTNDFGNKVELMVVDYQMAYQGGNGLMRLYEFDLTHNKIHVLSFSPWVVQKPRDTLTQFDQAVLKTGNEQFSIDMDFASRFSGFNKTFGPSSELRASLVDAASAMILAGYTEPDVAASRAPVDTEDYPKVGSTVAHWRFVGGAAGQTVAAGQVIEDRAGLNPLRRAALNSEAGVQAAQLDDLLWTSDKHYLSAAPGSVRFANTDKNAKRLSYFLTEASAPLNAMDFAGTGYTVEAFVKIDKDWSSSLHAWMNIMTRDGRRDTIPGFSGGDGESPPLLFAVSSLREIQWEVVTPQAGTRSPQASWSGEIMADSWVHIALVADPAAQESIMYIEGAPVLRNSGNASGLASVSAAMPWVVGAGSWDGERADGFLGNIGEIRIASEPLPSSQWLTARRS